MAKKVKDEVLEEKNPLEGFIDVSDRESMVYVFPNGAKLEVLNPRLLKICESGAHKVIDDSGYGLYIHPEKGYYLYWRMKKYLSNPYTF